MKVDAIVKFDKHSFELGGKLFQDIAAYIDERISTQRADETAVKDIGQ